MTITAKRKDEHFTFLTFNNFGAMHTVLTCNVSGFVWVCGGGNGGGFCLFVSSVASKDIGIRLRMMIE